MSFNFRRIIPGLRLAAALALAGSPFTPPAGAAETAAPGQSVPSAAAAAAVGLDEARPVRHSRPKTPHEETMELFGVGIGLVATVMGIGIGMLAVWADYRNRRELVEACHRERMIALEKGLEIPPYPPGILGPGASLQPCGPTNTLLHGLVWLAIGVSFWFILPAEGKWFYQRSAAGLPAAIGLACLGYYGIEGRKRPAPRRQDPPRD